MGSLWFGDMLQSEVALAWAERLGGWFVVLIVVRWMMGRLDRMIDSMQASSSAFAAFQASETQTHADLVETQRAILEELRELSRQTSRK